MKHIEFFGGEFLVNPKQAENVKMLVGEINDVLNEEGLLLCYCLDRINGKASKFHHWDIRPYPEEEDHD